MFAFQVAIESDYYENIRFGNPINAKAEKRMFGSKPEIRKKLKGIFKSIHYYGKNPKNDNQPDLSIVARFFENIVYFTSLKIPIDGESFFFSMPSWPCSASG